MKNSRIKPSITPEDVDKVFDILRKYFEDHDRKSVLFQSNRDKETELNQKEAHEMMKQQLEHQEQKKNDEVSAKLEVSQQQLVEMKKKQIKVEDVE